MHVVLIAAAKHPLREPFAGGLEAMTWQLATGLVRRGVQVTTFAGPGSDASLGVREIRVRELVLSHAARTDVSMPPEPWLREHHAYLQVMLELAGRDDVDVIHNNSLHYLPISLAAAAPAPMLTTLHTPPTPWLEPAIALMDQSRARFVAVSAHTARQWSHVAAPAVLPNGVDVGRWTVGPGGEDLVWSGRIVPEKAPHLAMDIARLAGRRLRLAGPIADRQYFRDEVEPRLQDGMSTYAGHLTMRELATLVGRSAAALVTPVWDEPYGLVAAEALACGTPVLGFARGGLTEVVGPDSGRLVAAGDVAAAAEQVETVTRLSRRAARAHAVTHCSIETMLDRYLELYETVADQGRGPATRGWQGGPGVLDGAA